MSGIPISTRVGRIALTVMATALAGGSPASPADSAAPSAALPSDPETHPTLLSDLPPSVVDCARSASEEPLASLPPASLLELVYRCSSPYEFDAGSLVVHTDPRWFSTLPEAKPGAPVLELRRWPGDTVVAFYAMAGKIAAGRNAEPPVPGGRFELRSSDGDPPRAEWVGTLTTEAGDRPALWTEATLEGLSTHLGALLLPGDAGFGEQGINGLLHEMRAVLGRAQIRDRVWRLDEGLPVGSPVLIPALTEAPGAEDESLDPWQVALATGFTLGLPPGVRARRTDGGVPPPFDLPGARLWLRGRFVDTEGSFVVIGDRSRAGYVARVDDPAKPWALGERPPLGAAEAQRQAGDSFGLASERTGARSCRAERWTEPDFDGDWLVFRLAMKGYGIEIGLPVLRGRESASLYWIPLSWRVDSEAPAPPPVDPAGRFGIRFEQFTRLEQQKRPWSHGYLYAPGLQVEMPRGWWPAASLRSKAGYPIRIVDESDHTVAWLTRIEPSSTRSLVAGEDWQSLPRPKAQLAASIHRRANHSLLFVAREGHGYLFRPDEGLALDEQAWKRMGQSVKLVRSERTPPAP